MDGVKGQMPSKVIITMGLISVLFVGTIVSLALFSKDKREDAIYALLVEETDMLIEFIKSEEFLNTIKMYYERNRDLSYKEIYDLDDRWIKSDSSHALVKNISENNLSELLIGYLQTTVHLKEIFVTDIYGLNIGMTNKTSDYYQADEAWWEDIYKNGLYKIGTIEYDASAQVWSYPIYVRISDKRNRVLGVMKALYDITELNIK